jgi:multisubunit Na+/H+ antiporter MnhB subunit
LRQYYPTPGTYVDDNSDPDGDGITNAFEYAFAFSPLIANSPGSGMQSTAATAGSTTTFAITFRRDPRATDLTYQMQTSDDLSVWNTITQSTAGAVPSGTGFVSESDAPGESPVKNVNVTETLNGNTHRFARLLLVRVTQ